MVSLTRALVQMIMVAVLAITTALPPAQAQLKKDGTPDMRYKANKEKYGSGSSGSASASAPSVPPPSTHLKKDGTPDMRYKENKDYYGTQSRPAPVPAPIPAPVPSRPSAPPTTHLKKDGTPDMRYRENKDYYGGGSTVTRPNNPAPAPSTGTSSRPQTTAPKSQWATDGNGRYIEPGTGRRLNNDGTYDMRYSGNKDLPNPGARVRIGSDNSRRGDQRNSNVNHRHTTVINNNYTVIQNTYIYNDRGYGSWGWQTRYFESVRWGASPVGCYWRCEYYTPTYWNYWISRYDYYPAVYYPYRPVILNANDLAVGLISWLFVSHSIDDAYARGRHDQYMLDSQAQEYYREALPTSRPVRTEFKYAQSFLPTEDFVELARDISGADALTIENFMTGLENMTALLESRIRQQLKDPNFTIQRHDIDVRLAENHGNLLVVLKGQIDRRAADGRTYIARADFTGIIDLATSAAKVFVPSMNTQGVAQPTDEEVNQLREIHLLIQQVGAQVNQLEQTRSSPHNISVDSTMPAYRR